jgi:hypothetical protein
VSWRDTTDQQVQDELDRLAAESLDAALEFLAKQRGEFYPFAMAIDRDGGSEILGADPGEGEHPSSTSVLDLLYESATSMRDGFRAVAFVAPVTSAGGDAVRVEIEHRDGGPALELLLPFTMRRRLRRRVEAGELVASEGERRVWS